MNFKIRDIDVGPAGLFFLMSVAGMEAPGIGVVAGYAGFGAFYFLVSAIWLTVKLRRRD